MPSQPGDIPQISPEFLDGLQHWVSEQAVAGLTAGTMVVRPGGPPRRGEMMSGLFCARTVLLARPELAERPNSGFARLLCKLWRLPSDSGLLAVCDDLLAQYDQLIERWHGMGVARWSHAVFLGSLGDLPMTPDSRLDVERRLRRLLHRLDTDPRGRQVAWREACELGVQETAAPGEMPRVIISQRGQPMHAWEDDDGT